jgi:hypothetical protein
VRRAVVVAGLMMALGGCARPDFVTAVPTTTSTPTMPEQTAPDPFRTFPVGGAPQLNLAPEKKAPLGVQDGAGRIRRKPHSGETAAGDRPSLASVVPVRQSPPQRKAPPEISNLTAPTDDQQFARVEELLRKGDVAGARLYLEHLSAAVAFRLAETYDPERLAAWQVVGVPADPKKARELYERALAGGLIEAQERLARLPQ